MYSVSDNYLAQIYESKQALRIYIDGEKVEDKYVYECKWSGNIFSNQELILGSTPSIGIELKLDNRAIPDSINSIYIESGLEDELIPIGYFNIDSISRDNNTTKLVLLDNMIKFEYSYDASGLINNTGSATLKQVVQDICNKFGVELGSTSFKGDNISIGVYDSSITARVYLGYIAEQAGCFACIGRDGKLYFRKIGKNIIEYPKEYLKSGFKFGNKLSITRVKYEDGIRDFRKGNESGNTLYINQDNMYITTQEQIDNIYKEYNGLELYGFSGSGKVDPAIDIGDIVVIDGKNVIYQGSIDYSGKFIASISSDIKSKEQSESTSREISQKTINRRIQSDINQLDGRITQVVEESTDINQKVSQVIQEVDNISQIVNYIEDFTKEKVELENMYIDNIAEGEGYLLHFKIYGNSSYFTSKNITICASTAPRGYGESVYLTTENSEELLTEDEQEFIIGTKSYYLFKKEIVLDDYLRSLTIGDQTYFDTLDILQDGTIELHKRIGVDNDNNLYLLSNEKVEIMQEKVVIPSIKDGIYYFIEECSNLRYYAKYITENDYSKSFLTKLELGTKIEQNAEAIKIAWNQISQYIKMEGIEKKASLNIYNESDNILLSVNQDGQTFYDSSNNKIGRIGIVRQDKQDTLVFGAEVDWNNKKMKSNMAWGIFDNEGKFLPIFYLAGVDVDSCYQGQLELESSINMGGNSLIFEDISISADVLGGIDILDSDSATIAHFEKDSFALGDVISSYINTSNKNVVQVNGNTYADNLASCDNISIFSAKYYGDGKRIFICIL